MCKSGNIPDRGKLVPCLFLSIATDAAERLKVVRNSQLFRVCRTIMKLETALLLALSAAATAFALDLRNAVIVLPANAASPERKAAQMLTEEIAKRTQLQLRVAPSADSAKPAIVLAVAAELPIADSYRVVREGSQIRITGHDPRGVLFGAGYLLRHLHMERQILEAPDDLSVTSAPALSLARPSTRLSSEGQHL